MNSPGLKWLIPPTTRRNLNELIRRLQVPPLQQLIPSEDELLPVETVAVLAVLALDESTTIDKVEAKQQFYCEGHFFLLLVQIQAQLIELVEAGFLIAVDL